MRDAADRGRLVGRERELAHIEAKLSDVLGGRGRILLLSGEAGIGKSRLLEEVQHLADGRGVPVTWGRAVEAEGAPAFWPWRPVLAELERLAGSNADAGSADWASLLQVLESSAGMPAAEGSQGTMAQDRFGVFEAVTQLATVAAAGDGAVILLDDLHWADVSSLRLLEHVAATWTGTRALLVAAHRPPPLDRDAPLRHTVAELARNDIASRIELAGLGEAEAAVHLEQLVGRPVDGRTVINLQRRTNGNPFFLREFGRLLAAGDAESAEELDAMRAVPQTVADAIARRVCKLTPLCQQVLEAGSVLGHEPDLHLTAAAAGVAVTEVLACFDEAAGAGFLTTAGAGAGYQFTHALVRDVLYAELSPARRISLHERVAAELESRLSEPSTQLSRLAHHWLAAAAAGHEELAAERAEQAADQALRQLAYEEAARLYEAAAGVRPGGDTVRRARLWLSAARSRFLAGELDQALTLCQRAAGSGRSAGDVALIAEAALVLEGVGDPKVSAVIADLCDEALDALPPGASTVRSRLLAQRTTAALYLGSGYAALEPLSRQALDIADQTGDAATIVAALRARHIARSDAAGLEERIVLAERMLALAQSSRNRVDEFWARLWRFDVALQQGRLDDAEDEVGVLAELVARIRLPLARWHLERLRFAVAHARGDFAAARRAADEGDRYARSAGQLAQFRLQMQELILSLFTGDATASAEAALSRLDATFSPGRLPTWVVLGHLTRCMLELSRGQVDLAAGHIDATPLSSVSSVMPPAVLIATAHRGVVAAALGRREDCVLLYPMLLPWADLFVSAGAGAVACFGSVERVLGLLARALGRVDTAVRHFERSVQREHDAGMVPWATESRYELALALLSRARDGDTARALPLVTESQHTAERLGMRPLAARAAALHEALRSQTRQARVLTPREAEIARLVAEGLTSREIADAMHISSRTADNHVQHILDKLGLRSRSQIAAWAARRSTGT